MEFCNNDEAREEDKDGGYINADDTDVRIGNFRKPSKFLIPLTKVNDSCFGEGETAPMKESEKMELCVSSRNAAKKSVVKDFWIFLGTPIEGFSGRLTPYDGEVLNAVCSLAESGQYVFSVNQIYETMAGKGTKNPKPLQRVRDSMRKLRCMIHSFDWTEHAQMNRLTVKRDKKELINGREFIDPKSASVETADGDTVRTVVYEDNFVHAECVTICMYGKKTMGYRLLKKPALLEYAKAVGQIACVDQNILNVPGVRNSDKNIVFKLELVKRIEKIRNKRRKDGNANTNIRLESLFKIADMLGGDYTEMMRCRNTLFTILDYFVEIGYIQSYEKNKEGTSVVSVSIIP